MQPVAAGKVMKYTVGDYTFDDEVTAQKARKEAETISYIRSRTDFTKPANAQKIINTIRNNNMFETQLGLDFVEKLERFVNGGDDATLDLTSGIQDPTLNRSGEQQPAQDTEDALHTFTADEEEILREEVRRRTKHLKETCEERVERAKSDYRAKARNLYIVIAAMAFIIVGLLLLTFLSDSSPFYNAEQAAIDKYSAWQEELDSKEQRLVEWESELKEREDKLNK